MQAAGMEVLFPMEKLAVNGYVEVLRHYREIVGIRRKLRAYFLATPPGSVHRRSMRRISISIWNSRSSSMAFRPSITSARRYGHGAASASTRSSGPYRTCSRCFRSKPELYQQAGVPVTYVGHPLADMLPEQPKRAEMRETMRITARRPKCSPSCPAAARAK